MQKFHQGHVAEQKWGYYAVVAFVSLLYLLLTFFAPQAANSFGLSREQIFFLKGTIALPYIATWFFAAYGLSTLELYLAAAKKEDVTMLALLRSFRNGLLWIVTGTIFVALIGGIKSYFAAITALLPVFTIVTNYLYVFPPLIGFLIIYKGVVRLESSEHKQNSNLFNTIIVLIISAFYIFLISTNPTRQFSADPAIPATYFLPDSLILLTIIIPITLTWWLGFSAAFTMSDLIPYLARAELFKGITRILYGIWSIIFASIIIQGLLSLGGTRLYEIGLGILLLVIYVFIFLQGLGYFLIALGSNSLRRSAAEK